MILDIDYIATTLVSAILDRYCDTIRLFTTDLTADLGGIRRGPIGGRTMPLPFNNGPIKRLTMPPLGAADYEPVLGMVQSA